MASKEIMNLFHLVLALTLFFEISCGTSCQKKFKNAKLAPKYFDYGTPDNLKVVFDDGSQAKCGNDISIASILKQPVVTYNAKRNSGLMSIIMFDADYPVPPQPYLNWFVVNIPVSVIKKGFRGQTGKIIGKYYRPIIPTGNNRYGVCVYYQNKYINKPCKKYYLLNKIGLGPRSLVKQYNLQNAVACNFFYLSVVGSNVLPSLHQQPLVSDLESKKRDLGNMDKTKIL